jgi:ferritin
VITAPIAEQLNKQLNREFFSAYFYLSLSAAAQSEGLRGAAAWFHAKYEEETAHALKFYRYLLDQGADVTLPEIAAPPPKGAGLLEMFEKTLAHEQGVTAAVNDLVDAALSAKDHATHIFLQWFVTEQIEEEATVNDIIAQLRLVGPRGEGLYMIDKELAGLAAELTQGGPVPAA